MLEKIIGFIARTSDTLFEVVDKTICDAVADEYGRDRYYWWLGFEQGFEAYVVSSDGEVFSLKNDIKKLSPHDGRVVMNTVNGRALRTISWLLVRASMDQAASSDTHEIIYVNGDPTDIRYDNILLKKKNAPPVDEVETALSMRGEGKTLSEIAEAVGKSTSTVHRWIKRSSSDQ